MRMIVFLQVGLLLSLLVVYAFSIITSAGSDSTSARLGTFAFYYPWYGTPGVSGYWRHWNEGNSSGQIPHDPNENVTDGRLDIAAEDYPLLGPYDSNNESVIEQHVEWAKEAGIGCFIVSWWGQDSFEDKALFNISKVCEKKKFNFTVYIENASSINQTVQDLTYLLNKYNDSRSWYRIDSRPVIFVYSRARNNLGPQAWNWHACTDSIGNDTEPNKIENAVTQWLPSEEVRKPPRYGIIPIQPFKTTPGYVETASPIDLTGNDQYWLNIGVSDIKNDSGVQSQVGIDVKIGSDPKCNDTLCNQTLHYSDGWQDLSFNITRYAGQAIYLRAESYAVGWTSEWAAADYFFINNSKGEIVSPDPFFDNGWNKVMRQTREKGANPYVIMDFSGFQRLRERIDGFLAYFQDCICGMHIYNPTDYSEDPSLVLNIYNSASESAHSRNMTFVATVVPGFNNTAVQTESRVIDRRDGNYYSLYWLVAKACSPDGYAITSFDEWHEGTETEPSIEYGYQYIYLTRRETIPFSSIIVLPLFMIATLMAVIVYRRKDHKKIVRVDSCWFIRVLF